MHQFEDEKGLKWDVAVNVSTVKRVKALLDVDLMGCIEGTMLERLVMDPITLCNVIYVLCKPAADAAEISDEQFGERMAGNAIDGATKALLEDLTDFFPEPRRSLLKKAVQKLNQLLDRTIAAGMEHLDSPALNEQLEREIAGTLSGDPPESSG